MEVAGSFAGNDVILHVGAKVHHFFCLYCQPKLLHMAAFNRRSFLDVLGTFSATAFLSTLTRPAWSRNLDKALLHAEDRPAHELAGDEDFWYYVQQSFTT